MAAPFALIFDVDGTLAETEELHRQAFNLTFAAEPLRQRWPDPARNWQWDQPLYRRLLGVTGGKERISHYLAQDLGIDPAPWRAEIAALHAAKTERFAALMAAGGLALRDGILALITDARAQGRRLAVATTTSRANVEALCQACFRARCQDIFEVVAAGDEVAAKKPAPDVYHLALARLGLSAERCVAFEDSANGVGAAKAAGLTCLAVPSTYSADDDLSAADHLLTSWRAVDSVARLDALLG